MSTELLHDRGRGPELIGTRIAIYNLLPHFLEPLATEEYICRMCSLSRRSRSAHRAYVLNNFETVMAVHRRIEARIAAGNPPEVIEQGKRTHERLIRFKEWLAQRDRLAAQQKAIDSTSQQSPAHPVPFPTFEDYLSQRQSRPVGQ